MMSSREISQSLVSLIIPVHNEEEGLCAFYDHLKPFLPQQVEIVFVNDGSTDHSLDILNQLRNRDSRIKLIDLSRNRGHQIALTAGLDYVSGDAVITLDADLQHPPEWLPRMLKAWEEGYDVVNMVKTKTVKRGFMKVGLATLFYFIFNRISEVHTSPHSSDFRLLDKCCVEALCQIRDYNRFIRGFVPWIGFKSLELPYVAPKRYAGQPSYGFKKLIQLAAQGFFSFSFLPLKLPLYLGLALISVLALYGIGLGVSSKLWDRFQAEPGWTMMIGSQVLFAGLTFVFLGVIGMYLTQLFLETKKRPLYFVKSTVGFNRSGSKLAHSNQLGHSVSQKEKI